MSPSYEMPLTGGQLVVEALRRNGVDTVFGLADTTILEILDALHAEPAIRYVGVRHEQVAAMMADAHARCTGRAAVCLTQCGAGAMNVLYGVASAWKDSVPMVVVTGNIDLAHIGSDAWHDIDVVGLFAPVTKASLLVDDVAQIGPIIDEAFALAERGRKGPVHVSVPKDIQGQQLTRRAYPVITAVPDSRSTFDAAAIKRAVEALASAQRPLIFAGGGIKWAGAANALRHFAEQTGIPVAVSDNGRGAIPESHPLAIGPTGFFGSVAATQALQSADVVLAVGTRFPDTSTGGWTYVSPKACVIHNNIDPAEIGRHIPVTIPLPGDARACLDALSCEWAMNAERLPGASAAAATRRAELKRDVEDERRQALAVPLDVTPGQRMPIQAVAGQLDALLPPEAVLVIDGGAHAFSSARLRMNHPTTFLSSSGLGSLGYGFAGAMGAKLALPDRPVVALVGDGGFAMVSQDLETAVRCNIFVVVVIYNNNAFMAQMGRQKRDYGGRVFGTEHGNPDFAALAQAYGAQGFSVSDPAAFAPAFKAAMASSTVSVIEVAIR